MYHSITFQKWANGSLVSSKNTWDDWHLVPSARPVVTPPAPKTNYVEIPGTNGVLDMSEAITGYPLFENRQGSFEFIVINESDGLSNENVSYGEWCERYSAIMDYLHGVKLRIILEDDPNYYYEGRFSVNEWSSEPDRSKITIDYSVAPYKMSLTTTTALNANYNTGSSWKTVTITGDKIGNAPTTPVFNASTNTLKIQYDGVNHDLVSGDQTFPEIMFSGHNVAQTIKVQGTGRLQILIYKGML